MEREMRPQQKKKKKKITATHLKNSNFFGLSRQ